MARLPRRIARALLPKEMRSHLERMVTHDAGHGYDVLGLHPDWVAMATAVTRPLYDHYFRATSHGAEHIPAEGGAILAANHSGTIPIDAVLIYQDVLRHTDPPRVPRPVGDRFLPHLPFVSTFFARVGMAAGTRGNVHHLLSSGELLLVFPEGTPGIGKGFAKRYQTQPFRVGHAELAIRHRVPVIPVGVIGAEEALIQLARIDGVHPFGAPYLPIPLTPFPLPARIHLRYGKPIPLHEGLPEGAEQDPAILQRAAERVRQAVQDLLDEGLAERKGIFR
jgi:1-acyl-sn-glycerol-3-phosphate acyltransferase